ncbi:MAG: DUF1573 domain-containing protein [Bacteroidales bacterium]
MAKKIFLNIIFVLLSLYSFSQSFLPLHKNGAIIELQEYYYFGQTLEDTPLVNNIIIENKGNSALRITDIKHSKNLKINRNYIEVGPEKRYPLFIEFKANKCGFYKEFIAFKSNAIEGNNFIDLEIEVINPNLFYSEDSLYFSKTISFKKLDSTALHNVYVGKKANTIIEVQNNGYRSIKLDEVATTKGFKIEYNESIIKPGCAVPINVIFNPQITGQWKGAIRIKSNNPLIVKKIKIKGTAISGIKDKYLNELGCIIPQYTFDDRLLVNLGKIELNNYEIIVANQNGNIAWVHRINFYQPEILCVPTKNFPNGKYSINIFDLEKNKIVYKEDVNIFYKKQKHRK